MLFYIYSDAVGSTIDITNRCRVGRLSVKDNAEEGSVAISDLIIDDPAGDLNMTGHRRLYIYESECPILDQVVYYGWTSNERVERGPYRVGAERQWTVSLADPNALLNRRIMNGTDANRPAETDLARMLALLGMTELDTISDVTFVNLIAGTVAMDAVDYRGQNVAQYIDDCRQASGKNAYVYYSEGVGGWGLWYDFATSLAYDSGIRLSNSAGGAPIDNVTTFGYSQERTYLNRDPSRVASGIYLDWDGTPAIYVQDTGTRDEFTAIDWAAPSLNVKSSAKATARANRYLNDADEEDEVIHTVMVNIPRNKVNVLKKGQLVQFSATHLPGYESYVTCRVLYRTVTEISEDTQASFEIEMDLSPMPSFCPDAAPTPPGYHAPLGAPNGLTVGPDGYMIYGRAGGAFPYVPAPYYTAAAAWHFPEYQHVDVGAQNPAGWTDFGIGSVRMFAVGPGTMTLYTNNTEGVNECAWKLMHLDAGDEIIDDSGTIPIGRQATTIEVPDDPDFCVHWVDLGDLNVAPTGANKFYFDGFFWTPA